MSAISRILVAIKDPWARSLPAVGKATQLAHALNAELQLFHARSEPLNVDVAQNNGDDLAQVEHTGLAKPSGRLEALDRPIRQRGVAVSCRVDWDFPAYEAVIRAAHRFKADLIVADRHLTSHRFSWLLHFTDFELLRLATMPVLLVKTPQPYRRPRVLAAVDPSHAYSKPRGLDREILRSAVLLSQALHGKLHAVHAFDPLPIGDLPEGLALGHIAQKIEAAAEFKASKRLARVLDGADVPESRRHMLACHPMDAIEQVASDIGSDIVVMGAISRSGLGRLIIGNTAVRVPDRLPCVVLIVKLRRFVSRVPRTRRGAQIVAVSPIQTGL